MVDIITDNIKPQIDAVGGGRKMTLQEDYDMGIDKGSFIYQENKDRYLKDKNVNVVMPTTASTKETGEVFQFRHLGTGDQGLQILLSKRWDTHRY